VGRETPESRVVPYHIVVLRFSALPSNVHFLFSTKARSAESASKKKIKQIEVNSEGEMTFFFPVHPKACSQIFAKLLDRLESFQFGTYEGFVRATPHAIRETFYKLASAEPLQTEMYISGLDSDLEDAAEKLRQLSEENRSLIEELTSNSAEVAKLRKEKAALATQVQELSERSIEQSELLRGENLDTHATLRERVEGLTEYVSSLEDETRSLRSEVRKCHGIISKLLKREKSAIAKRDAKIAKLERKCG